MNKVDKKIRILVGISAENISGGIQSAEKQFMSILEKRDDICLFTFRFGRKSDRENSLQKITERAIDLLLFLWRVNISKIDLVHFNSAFDKKSLLRDIPFAFITRLYGKKVFLKIHGSNPHLVGNKNLFWKILAYILFKFVNIIAVSSPVERNEFIISFGFKNKFFAVKNILPEVHTYSKVSMRSGPLRALWVSRLIKMKGIMDLLDASKIVLEGLPNEPIDFIVAGDGPDKKLFLNKVAEMNLGEHLIYKGFVDDEELNNLYENADIFIFTSYYAEGMPMAVADAMLRGVPLITTKTRFSSSYMEEGKHCLFIDSGKPDQLAEKVDLLRNVQLRDTLSGNLKKLALEFSSQNAVDDYLKLYRSMIN